MSTYRLTGVQQRRTFTRLADARRAKKQAERENPNALVAIQRLDEDGEFAVPLDHPPIWVTID